MIFQLRVHIVVLYPVETVEFAAASGAPCSPSTMLLLVMPREASHCGVTLRVLAPLHAAPPSALGRSTLWASLLPWKAHGHTVVRVLEVLSGGTQFARRVPSKDHGATVDTAFRVLGSAVNTKESVERLFVSLLAGGDVFVL